MAGARLAANVRGAVSRGEPLTAAGGRGDGPGGGSAGHIAAAARPHLHATALAGAHAEWEHADGPAAADAGRGCGGRRRWPMPPGVDAAEIREWLERLLDEPYWLDVAETVREDGRRGPGQAGLDRGESGRRRSPAGSSG
jgi:hypothetical protein